MAESEITQKKIAPAGKPPERLESQLLILRLADFGAEKLAVALHPHFAAAQQIGHGCDCFFCVLGARTDGENHITERKFRAGFEDQGVFLHNFFTFRADMVPIRSIFPSAFYPPLPCSQLKDIWMYP
jgi:hypothetical protein